MSLRTRLVLPALVSALAVLAGCGGNSNPTVTPPPSGGFANSNLSGTYVFSVSGSSSDQFDFTTMAGVFTADGQGNISSTGGVIDANTTAGVVAAEATITSGSYSVGADGRPSGSPTLPSGLLTLQDSNGNTYQFDFVLTSSEHGLLTEFDTNGSGSGTLDLQSSVAQSDINGQSYAFNFTGAAAAYASTLCTLSNGSPVVAPFSAVGAFTLDGSGNITSAQEDINNNCAWSGPPTLSVSSGSVGVGAPGLASIVTSAGTYSFDVFPIDATHLKFIEMDSNAVTAGDAFTQQSSFPSGNNVFTLAGFDLNVNVEGPFTAAGILNTDTNGNVTSSSVEDINDFFVTSSSPITGIGGSYSALSGGRSTITLNGFVNGNNLGACSGCIFAAYPSTGGLQLLEIDGQGITSGVAYSQAASPTLASGAGYGMNLSGVLESGGATNAEDDIAEFTNTNGNFSPGIIDFNSQGLTLNFKNTFQSTYAADNTYPGRGVVTPSTNGYFLTTYTVDDNTTVAVGMDQTLLALGAIVKQNSAAKSNAAAAHLNVLRTVQGAAVRAKRTTKRQTK